MNYFFEDSDFIKKSNILFFYLIIEKKSQLIAKCMLFNVIGVIFTERTILMKYLKLDTSEYNFVELLKFS